MEGRKTTTWRLFDDKDLSVGDEVAFVNSDTGGEFAKARITKVREKKLGEIEDSDYGGHDERYNSQEEMLQHYKGYYGDKVNLDTIIKIVSFELM